MLESARFIIEVLVLAVGVGYWAGEIKARRRERLIKSAMPRAAHESSGLPGLAELGRRVKELEDDRKTHLPRAEADVRFNGLWHEVEKLHALNTAIGRRFEGLERPERTL